MTFKEIETAYERLLADEKRLNLVEAKISICDIDVFDALEQMKQSNAEARQDLYCQVCQNFPTVLSELRELGEDFEAWVSLLRKYPSFINNREEALIGVFWNLCSSRSSEADFYIKKLLPIMISQRIVRFAAKPENEAMLTALSSSVEKVADEKQKLAFKQALSTFGIN